MSSPSERLLECSLQAALASIEIYNKPDFKYREQVFSILNVNAWELLLKAKILKDAGDKLDALYVLLPTGKPKLNRSGNPITIEVLGALRELALDEAVVENLKTLIEIRDTAVHFFHDDSLSYLVFTLGAASLRNYQKLISEWFGRSLQEYNFYILPLGFAYNFKTLSVLELEKRPEVISNLIKSVTAAQSTMKQSRGFHFVCEVTTEIRSAKKYVEDADLVTRIDSSAPEGATVYIKTQRLIDKYPVSYYELLEKVRKTRPSVKQHQIDQAIRDLKLKSDPKYAAINFRSRFQEEKSKKNRCDAQGYYNHLQRGCSPLRHREHKE